MNSAAVASQTARTGRGIPATPPRYSRSSRAAASAADELVAELMTPRVDHALEADGAGADRVDAIALAGEAKSAAAAATPATLLNLLNISSSKSTGLTITDVFPKASP